MITYTVTETDENGDELNGWVVTGGALTAVRDENFEIE